MRTGVRVLTTVAAIAGMAACDPGPAEGDGVEIVGSNGGDTAEAGPAVDGGEKLGTRGEPLSIGTEVKVGDWHVSVTDVTLDAWSEVQRENEFNEAPAADRQFVMFAVTATYRGEESGTAWMDLDWAVVGNKGNTFGTGPDDYCGVVPEPLDETGETFTDGEVTGNVCVSVPADHSDGGTIRVEDVFTVEPTRAFYALG